MINNVRSHTAKRLMVLVVATTLLLSVGAEASAAGTVKQAVPPQLRYRLPGATGDGKFKVVGMDIIGPNGGKFVPRGVSKGGFEYFKQGYEVNLQTFQKMKNWGANTVRMPINAAFWMKRMCTYDENYAKRIDSVVRYTEQLGMLLIIDNHMSTQGQTCGVGKWAAPQKAPDLLSLDMVKQLAVRYKNRPYVAIDLYNEPHDIPDSIWRNGGIVDGWRAVGMQQMLDSVRSTGAQNLVIATGNLWGNDLRMVVDNPLYNDKNVVYGVHSYPFWCNRVVYYEEAYNCQGKQYPPHLDGQIAPAIGRRPMMVSEFGTQRSHPGEIQSVIDWAESHKMGWVAWLWCNGQMTDFCLMDRNGAPSVSGKQVRDSLARANGRK